jgi:hypothetical protein
MSKRSFIVIGIGTVLFAGLCLAVQSTQLINFQGRLVNSVGQPINGSNIQVTFTIYDVTSEGTPLWSENQTIDADHGLYSVKLGIVNPIPNNLFNGSTRWLGVKVGTDSEMIPRAQITSVPYAVNSQRIGGKIIQSGRNSLSVSGTTYGTTHVSYAVPFAIAPKIIPGPPSNQITGKTFTVSKVENITTTGFDITYISLDGSAATGSADFDWIALGE